MLVLFAEGPAGPDVLLIQRSAGLRKHAGQTAFPGGAIDAGDSSPVAAALREAAEETGLDPAGVEVVGVLPELFVARSGFRVMPVLAWWWHPSPVGPGDPVEVAAVARVPLAELADPANRFTVRHPSGLGRPGVPGERGARMGLYRRNPGPVARAQRLGTSLGGEPGRGPATKRARLMRPQIFVVADSSAIDSSRTSRVLPGRRLEHRAAWPVTSGTILG